MNKSGTIFLTLISMLIITSGVYVYSQQTLTVDQAKNLFQQLGCIGCHAEGGVAEPFDEIIDELKTNGPKYNGDIDAYTRENVEYFGQKFDSFDALMKQMQANVGASDQDIQALTEFFKSVFTGSAEETKQQPGEAGTETTTTQTTQTETTAQPAETTVKKPPLGTNTPLIVFGVAAIIIIAVLLVVFTARK